MPLAVNGAPLVRRMTVSVSEWDFCGELDFIALGGRAYPCTRSLWVAPHLAMHPAIEISDLELWGFLWLPATGKSLSFFGTYFWVSRNGFSRSNGNGKMIVFVLSPAISFRACRYTSDIAPGLFASIADASASFCAL